MWTRVRLALLAASAAAGLLAACSDVPRSGKVVGDFDDLYDHVPGNAIVVTRTTSTEFQAQPFFQSAWMNVDFEKRGIERRAFYFPTRSTKYAPGAFGAYSIPAGEYRNTWNGDQIDRAAFWTEEGQGKLLPHFKAAADEVVYIGDINFDANRESETYQITIKDSFAEAKAFLEAKHPELAGALVKRLAYFRK